MSQRVKLHNTAIILSIILLLHSCNSVDEFSGGKTSGESPILLSAEPAKDYSRSYIPSGMYDNFKVHSVSEKGGVKTVVMDGYEVKYITDSWTYVTDTQPLMFWDTNADSYTFTAGAPIDAVSSISATTMTLKLKNNKTGSVMACEPLKIEKSSPNFGKTVNLLFGYGHCRVCVAFMKNSSTETTITDIKLTPDAQIASEANLTYNYDWSSGTAAITTTVNTTAKSSESFTYANVTIPVETSDAVLSATRYYCVPEASNTKDWTVSLTCNDEVKSASFVNNYTWESGKNYIYLFSLEENSPKLVYVISEEMTYFDCNDIIPGGSFSGSDMTEK